MSQDAYMYGSRSSENHTMSAREQPVDHDTNTSGEEELVALGECM
jgi:hypothetical protein